MKQNILTFLLCFLWFGVGCAYTTQNINTIPAVQATHVSLPILVYSETLRQYAPKWETEVYRRYPNSVLVLAHGNDMDGSWWCEYPDDDNRRLVSELIDQIRIQYPLRRIVLMICNPGGYKLDIPNISYALSNVWVIPDRELAIRSWLYPNTIGNIYEMQEN